MRHPPSAGALPILSLEENQMMKMSCPLSSKFVMQMILCQWTNHTSKNNSYMVFLTIDNNDDSSKSIITIAHHAPSQSGWRSRMSNFSRSNFGPIHQYAWDWSRRLSLTVTAYHHLQPSHICIKSEFSVLIPPFPLH